MPSVVSAFLFPKPKIVGEDLAGVVVAVGAEVHEFAVGDRVAAMLPLMHTPWGSLAEYAAVDEVHAAHVPEGLDLKDAASFPLVSLTALKALGRLRGATQKGKRILVQAGAGGVGTFAVQWASAVLEMEVNTVSSRCF